ncbi:hypothetical protein B9479_004548 [Cryptococcus floricola]|uniref:PCI domain-containing protein n=1 Tax=Cryptococcus floricola TaxID=2591691 RepID=A0A5D3AWZ2_9TREE|nr:hypothetical protein B9479_004548 [Cryptococcus floricola]
MADDSVPLPYPNLKVHEWHFQLQHVESRRAEVEPKFWEAVEKDEMAPYLKSLGSDKAELIAKLEEANKKVIEDYDKKIKEAEENEGESEVAEGLRGKAMYYARIGDKDAALPALETALEKTAGVGARIDLVLAIVRIGLFFSDIPLVTSNITRATELIDAGGDWDRRNRLKVYRALRHLIIREFTEAAELLIDSLSTFTATELMEYEEFVGLTVLAAGVGCDRKSIKSKILASPEVTSVTEQISSLISMTQSLHKCSYAPFFVALAEVETTHLLPSPYLAPHASYYVREMRIKAYAQLLESYRSLTVERFCREFGVGEAWMDKDLSRFIAGGRLACRIDKVSGVITTNKSGQNKGAVYEQVLKQGDQLLSDIQKLHRVVG